MMGIQEDVHPATGEIQALARETAAKGLTMRQARDFFDAMYLANLLTMSEGNRTHAADMAGVRRESLFRMGNRHRTQLNQGNLE